jgi:hypothetical protein
VLPQRVSLTTEDHSVFAKTFGENRLEIARKLLTEALKAEDNSEVKAAIKARLKLLSPKPLFIKQNVNREQ